MAVSYTKTNIFKYLYWERFVGHSPNFLNSPLHCMSTTIPVVVASAGESELALAALFANMQISIILRIILTNLGYPQPRTPILCDNEFVKGMCESCIRPKKSESMDMRLYALQLVSTTRI